MLNSENSQQVITKEVQISPASGGQGSLGTEVKPVEEKQAVSVEIPIVPIVNEGSNEGPANQDKDEVSNKIEPAGLDDNLNRFVDLVGEHYRKKDQEMIGSSLKRFHETVIKVRKENRELQKEREKVQQGNE